MGDSGQLLRERIQEALDSGKINKKTLCEKAGIGRPTLDLFLKGSDTMLTTVDRIADALEKPAHKLIDPDLPVNPLIEIVEAVPIDDRETVAAILKAYLGHRVNQAKKPTRAKSS